MSGTYKGMQARVKQTECYKPINVHCWVHVLSLVLQDVSKSIPLCARTFELLQQIYIVTEGSAKRHGKYLKASQSMQLNNGLLPLQSLSGIEGPEGLLRQSTYTSSRDACCHMCLLSWEARLWSRWTAQSNQGTEYRLQRGIPESVIHFGEWIIGVAAKCRYWYGCSSEKYCWTERRLVKWTALKIWDRVQHFHCTL